MKLLKGICIGLLLCLAAPAFAQAPPPPVAKSPFLKSHACFSLGYDDFIWKIRARNSIYNPKAWLLPLLLPRGPYEAAAKQLDCQAVTYENDGFLIQGWVIVPRQRHGRKLPVVIYNRGGNGGFGALKFPDLFIHAFPIAEQGFVVLASNYRGMNEDEPKKYGFDEFGGGDVRDVEKLIAMAGRIPGADPDNLFMMGVSRGAMMGYMAARGRKDIRAMAMVSGNVDLQSDLVFRPEMEQVYRERIPGYREHKAQSLRERSAIAWAEELPPKAPILLLHGSEDQRVSPANGPRMKSRLDALHHPSKLVVYEGMDHFLKPELVVGEVVAWFRANLAPAGR